MSTVALEELLEVLESDPDDVKALKKCNIQFLFFPFSPLSNFTFGDADASTFLHVSNVQTKQNRFRVFENKIRSPCLHYVTD